MSVNECYNSANQQNANATGFFNTLASNSSSSNSVNLVDVTTPAYDLVLQSNSSVALSADRDLVFDVKNNSRNIQMGGNLSIANNLSTAGNFPLTLTTSALTNATFRPGSINVVDEASSQVLSNKNLVDNLTLIVDDSGISGNAKFRVDSITPATTRQVDFVDSDGVMVIEDFAQNLKQKSLEADSSFLYDLTVPSKRVQFVNSGQAASTLWKIESQATTNQRFVVPDQGAISSPVMTNAVANDQTVNGILHATNKFVGDNTTNQFQLGNLANNTIISAPAPAAAQVINIPDSGVASTNFILKNDALSSQQIRTDIDLTLNDIAVASIGVKDTTTPPFRMGLLSNSSVPMTNFHTMTFDIHNSDRKLELASDLLLQGGQVTLTGSALSLAVSATSSLTLPDPGSASPFLLTGTAAVYPQPAAPDITSSVTIANGEKSFSIQTQSANAAADSATVNEFAVNCACVGTSQIQTSIRDYSGTGVPLVRHRSVGAGSFIMTIYNGSTAAALNSTMTINVLIV